MKWIIPIIVVIITDIIVNIILSDVDPSVGKTLLLIAFNPIPQAIIFAVLFFRSGE